VSCLPQTTVDSLPVLLIFQVFGHCTADVASLEKRPLPGQRQLENVGLVKYAGPTGGASHSALDLT
jgi:hypothetical protein